MPDGEMAEETGREGKRSWASEQGGKLGLWGWGTAGTGGDAEGNGGYWRGCRAFGGRSALVVPVCPVILMEMQIPRLGSINLGCEAQTPSVRICETV